MTPQESQHIIDCIFRDNLFIQINLKNIELKHLSAKSKEYKIIKEQVSDMTERIALIEKYITKQ